MASKVSIIGSLPTQHPAETQQFQRVEQLILQGLVRTEPWIFLVRDFKFHHTAGELIDTDVDWDGQIDLTLITESRIVLYELKAFTVELVYGTTNEKEWVVRRLSAGWTEQRRAFFDQASKQRAFFLREFLESGRSRFGCDEDAHFVVDSRLVFKPGSDLSGFFHRIAMTESAEEFESEVLAEIHSRDDKEFVRSVYSRKEHSTGKLRRRKVSPADYERLKAIYLRYGLKPRTAKWFRVISEDMIMSDLPETGSDRFHLSREAAGRIVEMMRQPFRMSA